MVSEAVWNGSSDQIVSQNYENERVGIKREVSTNVDIINEWVWSSRRRAKHFSRKRSPKAILHIFVKVTIAFFLHFVLGIACW